MIVKLTKEGGYCLHVEADAVLQQTTESGCIDLEICRGGNTVKRVLIGETTEANAKAVGQRTAGLPVVVADFSRAYIMENGKTVDTIRRRESVSQ